MWNRRDIVDAFVGSGVAGGSILLYVDVWWILGIDGRAKKKYDESSEMCHDEFT
jgi:hypothetical protein